MRQLVGLSCVLCQKSIGSIIDGQFCSSCGCPTHKRCARANADLELAGCKTCGANAQDVQREETLARQDKLDQIAASEGTAAAAPEWPVLFSSERSFTNPFALRMSEDRGGLEWKAGQILVFGRQLHELKNITDITLVRLGFPWLTLLWTNALACAMSFGGIFSELTPEKPMTWIVLAGLDVLLIISTITTKWIRITYRNQSEQSQVAYIMPVSPSGWRRFDGAADRLCGLLQTEVLQCSTTSSS